MARQVSTARGSGRPLDYGDGPALGTAARYRGRY
jgi:hypothetical protein